jgi:hypothetical protein
MAVISVDLPQPFGPANLEKNKLMVSDRQKGERQEKKARSQARTDETVTVAVRERELAV